MGRSGITNEGKNYDPLADIWVDSQGRHFIKNEFNPNNPIWIDISNPLWSVSYSGNLQRIDWDLFTIPDGILFPIRDVLKEKLKKNCPSYINKTRNMLDHFQIQINVRWQDFADISSDEIMNFWQALNPTYRPFFRSYYQRMVQLGIGGARPDIGYDIGNWVAREKVITLKYVRKWHETRGALISSEEEILRKLLCTPCKGFESTKQQGVRIFGWLLLETLKRSSQVLEIPKDGLKCVESNGFKEWFIEIRPIKHSTGLPNRWWHISNELAEEINNYLSKKPVIDFQNRFNRLIVWDSPSIRSHGVLSAADGEMALRQYVHSHKVVSPRTHQLLYITPNRIRHTGATRLAYAGVSRDIIQEILEHESSESCQAYIDAIGSDIVTAIDKAGISKENIFSKLNKSFFDTIKISEIIDQPIVLPVDSITPLIIGSCRRDTTKEGVCKKHPFVSCYAGCHSFSAWNDPEPHNKALCYFEGEKARLIPKNDPCINTPLSIPVRHTLESYDKAIEHANEIIKQIEGNL